MQRIWNYYDFHSHILPGMDDGARDPAIAAQMVDMLREQGVCTIAATSHYISHRESPETFIGRRERALSALMQEIDGREAPRILPGAEIYLEKGVSEKDLSPLMIHGTRAILLELPREPYQGWILREIEEIIYSLSAIPVMAHIERYVKHYRKSELEEILSLDGVVLQMNLSIFEDRSDEILETSVTARLLSFPNVMITSHQGFFTREALSAIAETTLENALDFAEGRENGNVVK